MLGCTHMFLTGVYDSLNLEVTLGVNASSGENYIFFPSHIAILVPHYKERFITFKEIESAACVLSLKSDKAQRMGVMRR